MVATRPRVYLSSADLQLESYLEPDSFERSLLLNMLFQPGVLVPDIFFFISTGIARHLLPTGLTLLEAGLRTGDIAPSFRDKTTSSFADALRVTKGAGDERQAIVGIRDDAETIAQRLDTALDGAANFAPEYWPECDLGRCFQQRIEEFLSNAAVPRLPADSGIPQARMVELWEYTEPWRTECVRAAVEETERIAGAGLRRGLLITAVGRAVGLVSGEVKLNDITELFNPSLPPEDLNALHYFCRWFTDIYQYNQACELGAIPNFPEYEPLAGVFASELLEREVGHSDGKTEQTGLSLQAPMPTRSALSLVSPAELLRIKNDVGVGYFAALRAWHADEKSLVVLEQEVQRSLTEYGNALVREVRRRGTTGVGVIEVLLSRSNGIDPILPCAVGNTIALAASEISPVLGVLMAVGTNAFAVYRWWHRRPEDVEVYLRRTTSCSGVPKNLDVNLVDGTHSLGSSESVE